MTGNFEKLFLDTAPIVYYLDVDERYAWKVRDLLSLALNGGKAVLTSVITATEYLTHPYRNGNEGKVAAFFRFAANAQIPLIPIDIEIAERAARIRAEYPGFKTVDSLQLAAACLCGCDAFLTNDKQLARFSPLRCLIVDDL